MNGPLRVLILSPTVSPAVTGNAVTAERWRQGLTARGLGVAVAIPGSSAGDAAPDVLHAHHLYKTGVPALRQVAASGVPLVVSTAGTDVSDDLTNEQRGPLVEEVLRRAAGVVVPAAAAARELLERFPWLAGRLSVVPRACGHLVREPFDLRAEAECGPEHLLFLLPAGVRPVKRNLECLEALTEVHRRRPAMRAVFLGPPLDPEYAQRFEEAIERSPFATWLGALPPPQMPDALAAADVVLNTSRSEGMSNTLLEAIAAGAPTLASDIQANRAVLNGADGGGEAGLLYRWDDWEDFVTQALRLLDQPGLRRALATQARKGAQDWPSAEDEARALVGVYRRALGEEAAS